MKKYAHIVMAVDILIYKQHGMVTSSQRFNIHQHQLTFNRCITNITQHSYILILAIVLNTVGRPL